MADLIDLAILNDGTVDPLKQHVQRLDLVNANCKLTTPSAKSVRRKKRKLQLSLSVAKQKILTYGLAGQALGIIGSFFPRVAAVHQKICRLPEARTQQSHRRSSLLVDIHLWENRSASQDARDLGRWI